MNACLIVEATGKANIPPYLSEKQKQMLQDGIMAAKLQTIENLQIQGMDPLEKKEQQLFKTQRVTRSFADEVTSQNETMAAADRE